MPAEVLTPATLGWLSWVVSAGAVLGAAEVGGTIWSAREEATLPRGVAVTPPIWIEPDGLGAMARGAILEGAVIFLPDGILPGEKSCLRAPDPGDRMWSLGPDERGESGRGEGERGKEGVAEGMLTMTDISKCTSEALPFNTCLSNIIHRLLRSVVLIQDNSLLHIIPSFTDMGK